MATSYAGADNVTVANASTEILAAKPERTWAIITNISDETVFLGLGEAAVANKGIALPPVPLTGPAAQFVIGPDTPWKGAVNGICASGSKLVSVVEI